MMKLMNLRAVALLSTSVMMLSACAIAPGYTDSEKEMTQTLNGSNFQPATREMRDNIETQELFAQAAFWSREYELNPGDLESAIKLSAAVRKLGNPQRAIEISQTTRALYPRDPYLTAEYAAALIASEQAYEAMKPLDEALRMAPGYARLWSLKGAALDQQENYDLARKHYAKALQITPNDPNIMANVGLSYALSGDANTAEGWLRRAVAVPGASKSVRQNLALVLQLQGKAQEAAKYAGQPKLRGAIAPTARPSAPVQKQSYNAPRPAPAKAPAAYQPRKAAVTSGIPASERTGYTAPHRAAGQMSMRQGTMTSGAVQSRNSKPMTASDAARLAAQQSSRRKVTMPLGQDAAIQSPKQQSVLDQISQNLTPKTQTAPMAGPQPQAQAPQSYAPQGYPAPQVNYAQPVRREAARSRR